MSQPRIDTIASKGKRVLTTLAVFLSCYVFCVSFYQLSVGALCGYFGFSPIVSFNAILGLPIQPGSWSRFSITVVFVGASVALVLLLFACLLAYRRFGGAITFMRFLLFWLSLTIWLFFLALVIAIPSGEIDYFWGLYQGLAVASAWWHLNTLISFPVAITAMALSIFTGYFACDELMKFSNSTRSGNTKAGRNMFLLQVYVLPVLIGFGFVFSLSTAYSFPLHALGLIVFILAGVGLFVRSELIKYGIKAHRTDILNINPIVPPVFIALVYGGVWFWFR